MRIEIVREKNDALQDVVNAACACRRAFPCLVVISIDGQPLAKQPLAEIPIEKDCLRNQQVWRDSGKPVVSRGAIVTAVIVAALYAVVVIAYVSKGRWW